MYFNDYPDILTVRQTAELTQLSENRVYYAIKNSNFPHFKINDAIRVSKDELINWMKTGGKKNVS